MGHGVVFLPATECAPFIVGFYDDEWVWRLRAVQSDSIFTVPRVPVVEWVKLLQG